MRILFIGEIVGSAGIYCVKALLPELKRELGIDLTIAAAEGATGGFGIGKGHAVYLHKLGVDVITAGDFAYFKRDAVSYFGQARYLLRPANYPYGNPGRGWLVARPRPGQPRPGKAAQRAGRRPAAAAAQPATVSREPIAAGRQAPAANRESASHEREPVAARRESAAAATGPAVADGTPGGTPRIGSNVPDTEASDGAARNAAAAPAAAAAATAAGDSASDTAGSPPAGTAGSAATGTAGDAQAGAAGNAATGAAAGDGGARTAGAAAEPAGAGNETVAPAGARAEQAPAGAVGGRRKAGRRHTAQGPPAAAGTPPSPGVGIISLLGQAGFSRVHLRNPFELVGGLIDRVKQQTPIVLVDFHATTTSEKVAMSLFLDGKVTAMIGTHVRTLSADARLLPGGTAAITHSGRTGSLNSVGGLDPEVETRKFLTQVHEQSRDAWGLLELQAVVLEVGADGAARSIDTLRRQTTAPEAARKAAEAARNRGPGRARRAGGRR